MLLQSPRLLIVDFWRKVIGGVRPARIELPDRERARGHEQLRSIGIDPDAPFAFFHMRTMKYREGLDHHGHRTASIERYAPSIRRILDAGYQVVRVGEAGLEPEDWMGDGYVSLPDALPNLAPEDRAVDLAVLADADFGTAQNSGPIWVAAAFGTPTLRTNTPFEHLNLPYNRDLSLFKHYSDGGRRLAYAENSRPSASRGVPRRRVRGARDRAGGERRGGNRRGDLGVPGHDDRRSRRPSRRCTGAVPGAWATLRGRPPRRCPNGR
ncbi:MAG: TIGR04372 family glycosyltransferase [Thalassobaculum sp.]